MIQKITFYDNIIIANVKKKNTFLSYMKWGKSHIKILENIKMYRTYNYISYELFKIKNPI